MINVLKSKSKLVRRSALLLLCLTYLPVAFLICGFGELGRELVRAYHNMRWLHSIQRMFNTFCEFIKQVWGGVL